MRLLYLLKTKSRFVLIPILAYLFSGCSGGGGQDPILGTPSVNSPPQVIFTTPAKSDPIVTGVANNVALTAQFNRDMLSSSLSISSFKVSCLVGGDIGGVVSYDASNHLVTFQQSTSLPVSTTCTATITTDAKDTNGFALASDYVWSFSTGTITTLSPTVVASNPQTGACVTQNISVTFSKAMDATTLIPANFYITNAVNVTLTGTVAYVSSSNTATVTVTSNPGIEINSTYKVNVTTNVKDTNALPLAVPYLRTFTTGNSLCNPSPTVVLGTISTYGTFGGGAGVTNMGINTVINGDLGTTGVCTKITGFHDSLYKFTETPLNIGNVTGSKLCDAPAPGTPAMLATELIAASNAQTAFTQLANLVPSIGIAEELGAISPLAPGIYKSTSNSFLISQGNLTLDAAGDTNAIWVFQMPASSLTVGTFKQVLLIHGAQAKNVFWQVGSAATIGYGSTMVGTIIADAGVTISTAGQLIQTTLNGRAIGLNASVTMVNTTVTVP